MRSVVDRNVVMRRIPICVYNTRIPNMSKRFLMKDITMCTQHLLTRSARRADDDRLKSSKHVASIH